MIYLAKELLPKLTHLTLVGQDEEGRLEFAGTDEQWRQASVESAITRIINY